MKPTSDQRLSDHVALGVLTTTFPPELVDEVLLATGRVEHRRRLLPARLVVYYVLALALYPQSSYGEVMRSLIEGFSWASGWRSERTLPTKGAIFRARARLGVEPLAELFARGCVPLATGDTPGAFYRGRRLVGIDGTRLDVTDTPVNDAEFGRLRPERGDDVRGFPQVRLVGLAECGTAAITSVAIGSCAIQEATLARRLLSGLAPGTLCMADRWCTALPSWSVAAATGADLLWRLKDDAALPVVERFDDGSFRSEVLASGDGRTSDAMAVRVVEPTADAFGSHQVDNNRGPLLTTIVDPAEASAHELNTLYRRRWEMGAALDDLKAHKRGHRIMLRSKTPEGVCQEIYGQLCTHYAIRALMHTAAADPRVPAPSRG